jgi:hypothetical protein
MRLSTRAGVVAMLAALASVQAGTQPASAPVVTAPREHFGARIGDDYFIATYAQLETYWQRLDRQSDRMTLVDIGRTEEGRTQWMAIVTAPENLAKHAHYQDIARRLALADGLTEEQARALAEEGKAVVWISGGLHGTEVLSAQQLIETVHDLVSADDEETERILRDVIVLAVHANPDGHELAATWYMRAADPRARSLAGLPRLDQKYAGHDNNRDFYIGTQAETINMSRILFREWLPQIVVDHHQADLGGTAVMYAPPYREPTNYRFDPLVGFGITLAGAAMHGRFAAERKAGVLLASGSPYSTWWNGGLRTSAYFHNQVGLLVETAGNPAPGGVRFRRAVEYSVSANRAVLDAASRYRETWLYNIYRMGKDAIERGRHDWWTASPHVRVGAMPDPRRRDPRGYVLPSDQPDFLTATKFVNALIRAGITVHRATAAFRAGGRVYPRGSYVVKTAQAFRPHILDMFEPQDHPDDLLDGGDGEPRAPYDIAGWTLALQMGVAFDRILEGFDGPFERIAGEAPPPAGFVREAPPPAGFVREALPPAGFVREALPPAGFVRETLRTAGYLVSHHQNDAFIVANRLLAAGERVARVANAGAFYIPATPAARAIVDTAARELGLTFTGVAASPYVGSGFSRTEHAAPLRPRRVGLVDRHGGWSTSGWIRWILERHEFSFEVASLEALDEGTLASRYDVLILPSEFPAGHATAALKAFVTEGGTLVAIGQAAAVAGPLGLPVSKPLAHLPDEEFFVPGSVLRVAVDPTTPLGYGFGREADVFFDRGAVFRFQPRADIKAVAWFATETPLRSGWARGQSRLEGTVAIVDAAAGRGRVVLFGPEITFRGQSHGTFKFLFNAILRP